MEAEAVRHADAETWELVDEWVDDRRKVRLEVRRDGHRGEEFREVWPLGDPLPVPSSLGKRIRELTRAKGANVGETFSGLWSAAIVAGQRLETTAEYQMLAALEATGERAERALERLGEGDAFLDPLTEPPIQGPSLADALDELSRSQVDLDHDTERILCENLWELYE